MKGRVLIPEGKKWGVLIFISIKFKNINLDRNHQNTKEGIIFLPSEKQPTKPEKQSQPF